ncbi:MAG: cytochrome c oxidase subunit I [Bacilli bacterium]
MSVARIGDAPLPLRRRPVAPVIRGLVWAGVAFVVVNCLVSYVLDPQYGTPFITQPSVVFGWVAAMVGWLLGIGGLENLLLPSFGYQVPYVEVPGWRRYFAYSTNHKVIGIQYLVSSAGGFFIAGLAAMLMRLQLWEPHMWLFPYPGQYIETVGIHGTIMMFSVGTVALVGGLGNYLIPMMLGSNSSAFPRISALSVWLVPAGIMTVILSPLLGEWTTGWRGYEPLAQNDPNGILFYYLGVFALTVSSLLVSLNLTATILFKRTKGLTWNRLPMYAWGILAVSLLNIIWLPEIDMTFVLGLLDRLVPLPFFTAVGSPLTYLEMFWLFGHPEVYIIVVPAFAIWMEIMPVMAKKPLFAREWGIIGLIFVMMLSGFVWAHHMFTNMRLTEMLPFSFFTEMISIPTGFTYMVVIGTIWRSRFKVTVPSLFVLMSMFNFLIGGLTGVFLADPVINLQLHDTFFVVAHFHFTIIGGMVFTWLAAMYYWLPKFSGRMYNPKLGIIGAIWVFIGFDGAFSLMFIQGMRGMNRWVPVYPPYLQGINIIISVFAFILGLGFLFNLLHIVWAMRSGKKVRENPWEAKTLEWETASPPEEESFAAAPLVSGSFYDYDDDVGTADLPAPGPLPM